MSWSHRIWDASFIGDGWVSSITPITAIGGCVPWPAIGWCLPSPLRSVGVAHCLRSVGVSHPSPIPRLRSVGVSHPCKKLASVHRSRALESLSFGSDALFAIRAQC